MIPPARKRRAARCLLPLLGLFSACGETRVVSFEIAGRQYDSAHVRHLALPKVLREVSGLAVDASGRLWAHNDERGVVYQIDYEAGRVLSRFDLEGRVKEDFEGIAAMNDRLFLVTSRGVIYETRAGEPEESVPFTRHEGDPDCEVEGLAALPDAGSLLVACKNLPGGETGVVVHAWQVGRNAYLPSPELSVPLADVARFLEARFPGEPPEDELQPSGIEIAPNGNRVIVAGRQHLLLELSPEGMPVAAMRLDPAVHRQAEGIAITDDGRLLVASEGDGKGNKKSPGVLSVYEPVD